MVRASRSSTVVTGGMPEPKVIAPSESTDTSSPLAPRRRRSTRVSLPPSGSDGDPGGFQRAQWTGDQAELHRGVGADGAGAVGDGRAVERKAHPAPRLDLPATDVVVEARDPARVDGLHGMILEIGSSMMPLAPRSSSSGMSVLISLLATTVSTAKPSSPKSFDTVGDLSAGRSAITPSRSAASTLSFRSTRPRASSAPVSRLW